MSTGGSRGWRHGALSEGGRATNGIDAYVFGRVGADPYPLQLRTRLEDVGTFERFVGGFAAMPRADQVDLPPDGVRIVDGVVGRRHVA